MYSSDGTTLDIGDAQDSNRLKDLMLKADELQSCRTCKAAGVGNKETTDGIWENETADGSMDNKEKEEDRMLPFALSAKKRRCLLRAERRLFKRHKNLVLELHRRAASYLASTSDIIVMPRMETHGMIRQQQKGKATIRRSTKRELMGWSHCKFVNRLYIKCHDVAQEQKKSVLLIQPEAYTSKTCGRCGRLHNKLGSNKTFKCPVCLYTADRDQNAACNMLIKAIC